MISLLFSYRNPAHEQRVREIVEEEGRARIERQLPGLRLERALSLAARPPAAQHDGDRGVCRRAVAEHPARGARPHQGAGRRVRIARDGVAWRDDLDRRGPARDDARVGADRRRRRRTLAGRRDRPDERVCTDIGGTSFDIALLTGKRYEVTTTPDIAKFLLNMPLVEIDSVGAGCGSFVRIDPNARRPEIGPDSAGAMIGTAWPEGGVSTVSITDLNLVLGRLNPEYFLGGQVQLDVERARHEVRRQIAEPLRMELEPAAAGVIELFETSLRNEAVGRILGKGSSPADYTLPLLWRRRPPARGRLHGWCALPSRCWCRSGRLGSARSVARARTSSIASTARSTCRCCRASRTRSAPLGRPPHPGVALEERGRGPSSPSRARTGTSRSPTWCGCSTTASSSTSRWTPRGRPSRRPRTWTPCEAFERTYTRMYARAASSPELGYLVAKAIVKGSVHIERSRRCPGWSPSRARHRSRTRARSGGRTIIRPPTFTRWTTCRPGTRSRPGRHRGGVHDIPDTSRPPSAPRRARHLPSDQQGT